MPEVGTRWGDFDLIAVLGRGAFATVYLARQTSMANRLVSLKLTARETSESDLLARLHHAAIVPIYSTHRVGDLQAVCMPYLGNTTLADLIPAPLPRAGVCVPADGGLTTCTNGADLLRRLVERQSRIDTIADIHRQMGEDTWPGGGELLGGGPESAVMRSPTARNLAGLSSIDSIVWIAAQIADGLAHAHRHHVWHCDIKPANILLSADGQPRLLDFNISVRPVPAGHSGDPYSGGAVPIGGTIAYMAPEQFASLKMASDASVGVDHRCDIYSLGVVLFQMLTGTLPPLPPHGRSDGSETPSPFGWGGAGETVSELVRRANPLVSPGLAAIVGKCLQRKPADRYPTADALYEDLYAHLQHRPLKHIREPSLLERAWKWKRRHPTLTSGASIAAIAVVCLSVVVAVVVARGRVIERLEMRQGLERSAQQLPRAIALMTAAESYPELWREAGATLAETMRPWERTPGWDENDVRRLVESDPEIMGKAREVARELELAARLVRQRRVRLDGRTSELPSAEMLQRWAIRLSSPGEDRHGRSDHDRDGNPPQDEIRSPAERHPDGLAQQIARAYTDRDFQRVVDLSEQLPETLLNDYATWLFLGHSYMKLGNDAQAVEAYTHCIVLQPKIEVAWYYRGIAKLRQSRFSDAERDFSRALRIRPGFSAAEFNRALAFRGMGNVDQALSIVQSLVDSGWHRTAGFALLGRLHVALGQPGAAQRAFERAMEVRPQSELDWIQRGMLMMESDPQGAVEALEHALESNPYSIPALQNLAHIYAERLGDTAQALRLLDRLVQIDAGNPARWSGRAVVLARRGNLESALTDLRMATGLPIENPLVAYQIACGYSLVAAGVTREASSAVPPSDVEHKTTRAPEAAPAPGNEAGAERTTGALPSADQLVRVALQWYVKSVREQPSILEIAQQDPDLEWLRQSPQWTEANRALRTALSLSH